MEILNLTPKNSSIDSSQLGFKFKTHKINSDSLDKVKINSKSSPSSPSSSSKLNQNQNQNQNQNFTLIQSPTNSSKFQTPKKLIQARSS